MSLNEKHLKILQVINAGNTTGEAIAEAMGSSPQMLRYYLDKLADDGYVKAAKVYDNATQDFLIVGAYLTSQGQAQLIDLKELIALHPLPGSGAPVPKSHVSMNGGGMVQPAPLEKSPMSQFMNAATSAATGSAMSPGANQASLLADVQNMGEVTKLIDSFEQVISLLPKAQRDLATVYLGDLQAEVKVPYRRDIKRINAYFRAFLSVTQGLSGTAAENLTRAATIVATKLNLPHPDL
jgi:DeoR family transcriptional regulator, catabolite repression regulator